MMQGYIISISANKLQISLRGNSDVFETPLPEDALIEGHLNPEVIAERIGSMLLENFGPKPAKLPLHFLVNPDEVFTAFLTHSKKDVDLDEFLTSSLKNKMSEANLNIDDTYFSYQKIAPFVYQALAVTHAKIEKYFEIANILGFELKTVTPWALLLPKLVQKNGEPQIFFLNLEDDTILVLSELGGVYYVDSVEDKSSADFDNLIEQLSIYERTNKIKDVFLYNASELHLGDSYNIKQLESGSLHELFTNTMTEELAISQINILNLLPLPVEVKSKAPAVYVGAIAVALLVVGGFIFGPDLFKSLNSQIAGAHDEVQSETVAEASETVAVVEPVEVTPVVPEENSEEVSEDLAPEYDKAFLRIRVENGTNIGGLAGKTQALLLEAGYDVVAIGDAETSEQSNPLLKFSPENLPYAELLKEDLMEMYSEIEIEETLDSELDYDVLIIAGSALKE